MRKTKLFLILVLIISLLPVEAHRSGCHDWHSCPSDRETYECGDTGHCNYCPDNQYCQNGKPISSISKQEKNISETLSDEEIEESEQEDEKDDIEESLREETKSDEELVEEIEDIADDVEEKIEDMDDVEEEIEDEDMDEQQSEEPLDMPINQLQCVGCEINQQCLQFGIRYVADNATPSYCDFDKTSKIQKQNNEACQNNYECVSNSCSDGKCTSVEERIQAVEKELKEQRTILQKILDFFKRLFG